MSFFTEQQHAAVIKHGILRRYLPIFAQKTGSSSRGGRVVYLDGYAGPGAYDDGKPGSPLVAAVTAEKLRGTRALRCLYVEKARNYCERLEQALANHAHDFRVLQGPIESRLDECLVEAEGVPLFAFFDPFGLGLPFEDLTRKVLGRPKWPPTEVLLNFSFKGLERAAGRVMKSGNPDRMNAKLGGSGWLPIWEGGSADRDLQIAIWFFQRIQEVAGPEWRSWIVPVAKRLGGSPVYCLILLTRHPDGLWFFYDQIVGGMEDFRDANLNGQLELIGEEASVAEIRRNVRLLLEKEGTFRVSERLVELFGQVLGHARTKLIRQAIKELHEAGGTSTTGRGDLKTMQVYPATLT